MKYVKPKSLTWWAAFIPLSTGVFVGTADVHGMVVWVDVVNNMTDLTAASMIDIGLIGIGLRGAVG